ncbi:MAG: T9SS type A sorting domain-containing protein [bacterium]
MMNQPVCRPLAVATILLALTAPALAGTPLRGQAGRMPDFAAHEAVMDSLREIHPRYHARWLNERGLDPADFILRQYQPPEGTALRQVGKWGRGRSVEVTGQDSLVFLSLGSEIAIFNFSDPDEPKLLTELQLDFRPTQTYVRDSLLVTGGWSWIETWNIANPVQPVFRGRIPHPVADFCLQDSLLFLVSGDSFRVFSIADPARPYQLGASRDSGWATTVTGNTVVLVLRSGFGFMDVSDPSAPRRVGFYGGNSISASARGTICCISNDEGGVPQTASFEVLDITNPAMPVRLSKLTDAGGYDIHLADTLAFVSGWQHPYGEFCIIDISSSQAPRRLSMYTTPGDNTGIWASLALHRAFIADWREGLQVLDIRDLAVPTLDTTLLVADQAEDIAVSGDYAYVANYAAGMRVLDISRPATPAEVGSIDTTSGGFSSAAVTVRDSFAFVQWWPQPYLRSVSIENPLRPTQAGGVAVPMIPAALAIQDTFLYLAGRFRFQVVNVARPREPVLVGSCVTQDGVSFGLAVQDSFAYIISGQLQVVNIARPDSPFVVGTARGGASGIAVLDSFVYVPYAYDTLWVYSVADPSQPRLLFSTPTSIWPRDVALGESTLYVAASRGWGVDVFDLTDPGRPVRVGRANAPHDIRRLHYADGRLYAAMWEAGVAIYETTATGLKEPAVREETRASLAVRPTLTRGELTVLLLDRTRPTETVRIYDVSGRTVSSIRPGATSGAVKISLAGYPTGVYWVEAFAGGRRSAVKVIKQ